MSPHRFALLAPALLAPALLAACAHAGPAAPPAEIAAPLPRGGAPVPVAAPAPPVRTLSRLSFAAVGDVLMHDAVKRSAATWGNGAPDAGFAWLSMVKAFPW